MDFFGMTVYGYAEPIKQMMRDGYKEPKSGDKVPPPAKMTDFRVLDIYTYLVDGYAYESNDLLRRLRVKHVRKPVGPLEMYRFPGCTSMEPGWFLGDPTLKNQSWYKPIHRYPVVLSEMSRFVDKVGMMNAF